MSNQNPNLPLDGIGAFLLFLIGAPALVLQSLDPELRRVLMNKQHRRALAFQTVGPVLAALAWAGLAIGFDLSFPKLDYVIWAVALLGLIGIAVLAAVVLPSRYSSREAVIASLEAAVVRGPDPKRPDDRPALLDLIELGKQSSPGYDKELVLLALCRLADQLTSQHPRRSGELELLVDGLMDMLITTYQSGSSQNFYTAAEALQSAVTAQMRVPSDQRQVLPHMVKALSALGRAELTYVTLTTEIDRTLMKYVQVLSLTANQHGAVVTNVSEALAEIGMMAVDKEQMLIAVSALESLFTLAEDNSPAPNELAVDLLSLAARFWAEGGAARERVYARLPSVEPCLAFPLLQAVEAASRHCERTTQFQAADRLRMMKDDLVGRLGGAQPA